MREKAHVALMDLAEDMIAKAKKDDNEGTHKLIELLRIERCIDAVRAIGSYERETTFSERYKRESEIRNQIIDFAKTIDPSELNSIAEDMLQQYSSHVTLTIFSGKQ